MNAVSSVIEAGPSVQPACEINPLALSFSDVTGNRIIATPRGEVTCMSAATSEPCHDEDCI